MTIPITSGMTIPITSGMTKTVIAGPDFPVIAGLLSTSLPAPTGNPFPAAAKVST